MILVDANLLIYAHHQGSRFYAGSRPWFESALRQPEGVGLAWVTILAFLRLTTSSHIFAQPLSMAEAQEIVAIWMTHPAISIVSPSGRHWEILSRLFEEGQVRSDLVTDAHLAALAIEHGATLCTTDRDFARFPGLHWQNPLQA